MNQFARTLALGSLGMLLTAPALADAPQSIAVPAYFYPSYPDPVWQRMHDAFPTVALAVMNPASGPGAMADPNYVSQIAATRAAGIKVIGYVTTSYAARSLGDVQDDIDPYYDWYGVDGIFFDEAANGCMDQPYYAALDSYVKAKGGDGITVINPGINTPECFITAADILLNFEGSFAAYQGWTPDGWEASYDPSRFWHLVYATPEASAPAAVLLSKERGAGWVYVTDDVLANPWDTLPPSSYWATELSYVQPGSGDCGIAAQKPKLKITSLELPAGDEVLIASARATLADPGALDPVTNGVRLVLADETTTLVESALPGGAFADPPGRGWKVNGAGTTWTYSDRTDTPLGGITRLIVKDASRGASPGVVSFKVKGYGDFTVEEASVPPSLSLFLDASVVGAPCMEAAFVAPAGECSYDGDSGRLQCR